MALKSLIRSESNYWPQTDFSFDSKFNQAIDYDIESDDLEEIEIDNNKKIQGLLD